MCTEVPAYCSFRCGFELFQNDCERSHKLYGHRGFTPTTTQANMIKSDEEANEIFEKAHAKDEKGDHKGYLEDILRFLEYAEKTGNQKWTSVASQNAGIAYNTIGDHEKAVEYHLKHLEMALALGDTPADTH